MLGPHGVGHSTRLQQLFNPSRKRRTDQLAAFGTEMTRVVVQLVSALVHVAVTCDLGVQALAQIANMSPRNFSRAFSREAKVSPAEFVELARLDAARRLLEHDRNPLKTIALNCGFRDGQHMRDVFRRRLGVSPQQYRSSFGMVNAARQNG